MTILVDLFTFGSVFLLILALYGLTGLIQHPVERRIQDFHVQYRRGSTVRRHSMVNAQKNVLAVLGERIAPTEEASTSASKKKLAMAGYYSDVAYYTFWGIKLLLAILFPLALTTFLAVMTLSPREQIIRILFVAFAGLYLPNLFLYFKKKKRHEDIFCGMPDMLDLTVVCVEAGLGLDAALQKVSDEFHLSNPTLSTELRMTCTSVRLGQPRDEALHDLGERTDSRDLKSFIAVVIQSEKFGTSIAQALRTHAEDLRVRRRQRAEEMAAKTAVKLIFPLVLFIFPAIFVVTAGPAVIRIYEHFIKQGLTQ